MVMAWVVVAAMGAAQQASIVAGFIPARLGGVELAGAVPAWLTPLSACFVHGDIVHLGFNMALFVFCGRQVELVLGGPVMAGLLLFGAYAAAGAQWALDPGSTTPMIGASGAISAIVALYSLLYNDQTIKAVGPIPGHIVRMVWLGIAWVGLQILIGYAYGGSIAYAAHIGGFVAGLIVARPLLRWRFRIGAQSRR